MGKSLKLFFPYFFTLLVLACACGPVNDTTFDGEFFGLIELDSTDLSIHVMTDSLEVPWDLCMGLHSNLWFTEQKGTISRLNLKTGEITTLLTLSDVHYQKSRGLLSMALHPDFKQNPFVYFHYNYLKIEEPDTLIKSRLVRYKWDHETDKLNFDTNILDEIPGQTYHNGSRLIISHDNKLLLTTGDAGRKMNSQDSDSHSGKLLRINLDGSIPDDNPYPDHYVYAIGLRNSQGLTYGRNQRLYGSDHGPNNDDEINILEKAQNYGWPIVEGYCNTENEIPVCDTLNIKEPIKTWTPTVAPAGIAFYDHDDVPEWKNSLLQGTLKGQFLGVYSLDETGEKIIDEKIFLHGVLGRIRDVAVSANGDIYLSTSNKDWHPKSQPWMYDSFPSPTDDRIIRISSLSTSKHEELVMGGASIFKEDSLAMQLSPVNGGIADGRILYEQHCANCHLKTGAGIPGLFPPLSGTDWVTGDKKRLINLMLNGLSGEIEVNGKIYQQEMPGFKALLSDTEIATILTFIRGNFGNNSPAVHPVDVTELRK